MSSEDREPNGRRGHVGAGEPLTASWQRETSRRAEELRALSHWTSSQADPPRGASQLKNAIEKHLCDAVDTAGATDNRGRLTKLVSPVDPSAVDAALGSLDAAEADLLRITPLGQLPGQMSSVEAQVYRYLPKADPRRRLVEDLAHESRNGRALPDSARDPIVNAYHAAGAQRRRELSRVSSFTTVLIVATIVLFLAAVALALVGVFWPRALPLCFHPLDEQSIVCPLAETPAEESGAPRGMPAGDFDDGVRVTVHPGDIALVELVGLLAAGIAVVTALRGLRGSSTPFQLPLALAVLKLPAGAVTAVLGLLFIRGGFVPGLSALDSSAQILAWAVVFGYAQQLFTGLVDQQAHGVLESVGGRGASGERSPS